MYPEDYPQSRAVEKGIDVAIAVDMIRMGLGNEMDVGQNRRCQQHIKLSEFIELLFDRAPSNGQV